MRVILGNYAPPLSSSSSRSGAGIVCARQEVAVCMFGRCARCLALAGTRLDVRTKPAMLRAMGLR
jgi:hypothetical protein